MSIDKNKLLEMFESLKDAVLRAYPHDMKVTILEDNIKPYAASVKLGPSKYKQLDNKVAWLEFRIIDDR